MICTNCQAHINDHSTVCPCCTTMYPPAPVPDPRNARIERLRAECLAWRGHFQYGTRLELGVKPACNAVNDNHDLDEPNELSGNAG